MATRQTKSHVSVRILTAIAVVMLYAVSLGWAKDVTVNVTTRVFAIRHGSSRGTAFTLEIDNKQYVVTAAHVLRGAGEKDTIEIFHADQWKSFLADVYPSDNDSVDVAVLVLKMQISPTFPLEPTSQGMGFGQDAYFLGFPYLLQEDGGGALNGDFPMPFVKRGVISAISRTTAGYTLIYVDGHANRGFSGGPLVYYDEVKKEYQVAGVVKGYATERDTIRSHGCDTTLQVYGNAGYVIVIEISAALEIIKEHPVGVDISTQ